MYQEINKKAVAALKKVLELDKTDNEKMRLINGIMSFYEREKTRIDLTEKQASMDLVFFLGLWSNQQSETIDEHQGQRFRPEETSNQSN